MKFIIRGGKKLSGEIKVMGAKNAALKAMAASLLFSGPVTIENIPLIEDVFRMRELLEDLGVGIEIGNRTMMIRPSEIKGSKLKNEIAERLRASIVVVGPLLARKGQAVFPHPGGCVIGKRPIDVFLDGWRAMGAKIKENKRGFFVKTKKLRGTDFTFRIVSVTGTEALMMTAVAACGTTVLRNAAMEPEISALAEFLNVSGAKIFGAGTPTIEIKGNGGKLLRAKHQMRIIPDRIEAGSFLILGAALAKKLKVAGCIPEHLSSLIASLRAAGAPVEIGKDWVSVGRPHKIKSVSIQTREYPGFPTDLQAPFAVLMTQAEEESVVFETIFEGRFGYVDELRRMGGKIFASDQHRIVVKGPDHLRGREIESPDLRAGLALVIAALLAKGISTIGNIYQIDRGYEKIDERLRLLGAQIERVAV